MTTTPNLCPTCGNPRIEADPGIYWCPWCREREQSQLPPPTCDTCGKPMTPHPGMLLGGLLVYVCLSCPAENGVLSARALPSAPASPDAPTPSSPSDFIIPPSSFILPAHPQAILVSPSSSESPRSAFSTPHSGFTPAHRAVLRLIAGKTPDALWGAVAGIVLTPAVLDAGFSTLELRNAALQTSLALMHDALAARAARIASLTAENDHLRDALALLPNGAVHRDIRDALKWAVPWLEWAAQNNPGACVQKTADPSPDDGKIDTVLGLAKVALEDDPAPQHPPFPTPEQGA